MKTTFTKYLVMTSPREHFIDSIKRGSLGTKQGVVQSLERINYYTTVSQLRRITDPASGSEVTLDRRRLHVTQYGGICPLRETPERSKCWIKKGIISHGTNNFWYWS